MELDLQEAKAGMSAHAKAQLDQHMINVLTHKMRGKAFYKKCTFQVMEQIKEVFDYSYELRREEFEKELAERKEKEEKVALIKKQMLDLGLTAEDVFGSRPMIAQRTFVKDEENKNKPLQTYKYRVTIFGKEFLWTGVSNIPLAFRCAVAQGMGAHIRDFKLPPEEWIETQQIDKQFIPPEYRDEAKKLDVMYKEMFPPQKHNKS